MATNLIYLQIMLLLAIEADNRDPASTRGQAGPPQSVWLGSAVGLAYSMKLHVQKMSSQQSENDPDSDDKLARRIWWSLVIMDRWHAASTASPLLIPDTSVVVYPEDQALLGENVYQLARESTVRKLSFLSSNVFRSIHRPRPLHAHSNRSTYPRRSLRYLTWHLAERRARTTSRIFPTVFLSSL
jgi:hypothetical protein